MSFFKFVDKKDYLKVVLFIDELIFLLPKLGIAWTTCKLEKTILERDLRYAEGLRSAEGLRTAEDL